MVNVSNPEEPDLICELDTPGSAYGVYVSSDLAYVADVNSGLRIIDVSDPEEPEEVGSYDTPGAALDVFVVEDFAFVADGDSGLIVIDVADLAEPLLVESYWTGGTAYGVFVSDGYAYVASYTAGLSIFDVSELVHVMLYVDPRSLDFEEVGVNTTEELPLTISNEGDRDLTIHDITLESEYFSMDFEEEFVLEPEEEYELTVTFTPEDTVAYEGRLTIFSDAPFRDELIVRMQGVGVNEAPDVENPIADIVIEEDYGQLIIADLDTVFSDPNNNELVFTVEGPEELNLLISDENVLTLEPAGNFHADSLEVTVVADDGQDEARILRFAGRNPADAASGILRTLRQVGVGNSVSTQQSLTIDSQQSTIDNQSSVFHPELQQLPVAHLVPRRDLTEDIQFMVSVTSVNDLPSGFALVEPSDSATVADYPAVTFSWEESIDEVEGDTVAYALVLTFNDDDYWYRNIETTTIEINREDLSIDPNMETTVEWAVWANDGTDSIQCNESFSLTIAPLSVSEHGALLPTELSLGPIYPNPFNAVSTIRYALPTESHVTIMVYNLMGQQVASLVNGYLQPGFHYTILNAADLPSGLYFVRLKASDKVFTQKVMLIR